MAVLRPLPGQYPASLIKGFIEGGPRIRCEYIELSTPHGKRSGRLTLKTDGNSLSGSYTGGLGEQSFDNGTVNADEVAWSLEVTGPMANVKLDFKGTASGDEISGQVQLGSSGSSDFKAIRA